MMYSEHCAPRLIPSSFIKERGQKRPLETESSTHSQHHELDDDFEIPEEVHSQVAALLAAPPPPPTDVVPRSSYNHHPRKRRRRVRFVLEEEGNTTPPPPQNVMNLPVSKLTPKEIRKLWIQKSDYRSIFTSAMKQAKRIRSEARKQTELTYFTCYSDALAKTYFQCCNRDKKDGKNKPISLDRVAFLSLFDSSSRGLESQTLPREISLERHSRRTMTIKGVLKIQGQLRSRGYSDESISASLSIVSEYFSKASRKFARVLGEVDGTSAMFDYEIYNVGAHNSLPCQA